MPYVIVSPVVLVGIILFGPIIISAGCFFYNLIPILIPVFNFIAAIIGLVLLWLFIITLLCSILNKTIVR